MRRVWFGVIFFLLLPVSVMAMPVSNEVLLEQMNKRFEELEKRMDQRFEQLQREMDQRFEQMQRQIDQRFEQMHREMYNGFDQVDKRFGFIQYLLIALLASVVGMPLLARKWEKGKEKDIDEFRRHLIAMKQVAANDERIERAFKAAGLL